MDFLKGCRCDSVKVVMGRSLGTPGLSGHMQGSLGPPGPWWVMKRPTRPAEYLRSAPAAGCNFQFSSFVQAMINAGGGQELLQGPSMPQQRLSSSKRDCKEHCCHYQVDCIDPWDTD